MNALLIDVEACEVRPVVIPWAGESHEHITEQCDAIRKLVGAPCEIFTHVRLSHRLSLWVDDEGLLNGRTKGFMLNNRSMPIMGNGVVTSMDPDSGDIVDLNMNVTPEMVRSMLEFVDSE